MAGLPAPRRHAAAAEVALEACESAYHRGRELQRLGHRVTPLHPRDVARSRDGNKTDRADAKAVLEARRNREPTPVPVESVEQPALVALHRLQHGSLPTRTARVNALRGPLREFGEIIRVGARHVLPRAHAALADDAVPEFLRPALESLLEEITTPETRADGVQAQLTALVVRMPAAQLLRTVPGIGVLTATALVAVDGDIHASAPGAASPHGSASPHASAPAAPSAASARSRSTATSNCARAR